MHKLAFLLMAANFFSKMTARNGVTRSPKSFPVQKSEEEWKRLLSKFDYGVLREKDTEKPFTGEYDKVYPKKGYFACKGCCHPLYSAAAKFNSGCGWPAFDKIYKGAVVTETDFSLFVKRTEILCANCGGHLGHVFEGEHLTETNERHCVNSASVVYVDKDLENPSTEVKILT